MFSSTSAALRRTTRQGSYRIDTPNRAPNYVEHPDQALQPIAVRKMEAPESHHLLLSSQGINSGRVVTLSWR
jgi:hypothetical protein